MRPHERLSDADIAKVLKLRAAGVTQKDVARRFGCSEGVIGRVIKLAEAYQHTDVLSARKLNQPR